MKVFVYGSLRKTGHFHSVIEDATFISQATMKGKIHDLGNFPGLTPEAKGEVIGEVYDITERMLHHLDLIEGFRGKENPHNFFVRTERVCKLENGDVEVKAIVYIYPHEVPHNSEVKSGDWIQWRNERKQDAI